MANTIEQIIDSFIALVPLWDENVWTALQERRFTDAQKSLQHVLSGMLSEEWVTVPWTSILDGTPAFRGDLDPETWKGQVLPIIGMAILTSASAQKLSAAYASIDPDFLGVFHNFLIATIPGQTSEEKLAWTQKSAQASLSTYLIANPLGLHFTPANSLNNKNIARLKTLTGNLRSTLFSMQTAEVIKKMIEQNNIPDGKTSDLADAVGLVLLGFLHPEELSGEIVKNMGIPLPVGKNIADSFNNRIFHVVQKDLDQAYAPLLHEHEVPVPQVVQEIRLPQGVGMPAPKMMNEAFVAQPKSVTAPQSPVRDVVSQTIPGNMGLNATPFSTNKNNAAPAPSPKAPSSMQPGWSKTSSQEPVVKLGAVIASGIPSPKPAGMPPASTAPSMQPMPPKPSMPVAPSTSTPTMPAAPQRTPMSASSSAPQAVGEFGRMQAVKSQPSGVPVPAAPAPQAAPAPKAAPFILHQQDPNMAPAQKTPDFRLQASGMQNQMSGKPDPLPVKPAVLELGGTPKPTTPAAPKVVHYSDYKTTTAPMQPGSSAPSVGGTPTGGAPNNAPRQVTELTSSTPPPTPGAPTRVITKDFLSGN